MNVLETIRRRRSIRHYRSDEIPDDVLEKLLEVMRLAPSSGNRQPYKFIVVRDKATRVALASACRWNPGRTQGHEFMADAPLVMVACGIEREAITRYYRDGQCYLTTNKNVAEIEKDPLPYWNMMPLDVAVALDYVDITATSLGLGTCWVASLDELAVKKVLSIPDDIRVVSAMAIGYPSTTWPEPRPRKALEKLVCYERYV
ncbi:MAG: nitroreductase family protein [Dehalococcoidales bacterium]|nr:nitroreductase family protein [Dehalococcoidales bacterium]